jgi:hypothetical protein
MGNGAGNLNSARFIQNIENGAGEVNAIGAGGAEQRAWHDIGRK